jgi:predicted molibdopterin-dependent oxidoreductase YjgC
VTEGLADEAFIRERCDWDEYQDWARFVSDAKHSPEFLEPVTKVPAQTVREAARLYATGGNGAIYYGLGVTEHSQGSSTVMAIANLAMCTGNIGRRGVGVNPLRGQNNVQGACDMGGLPNVYPGYQVVTIPEVQKKFQDAWGSTSHLNVGLTVTEMVNAVGEGKVRALFVMGENPMVADPDITHARHCLEKTEFLVVQDIFLSETARLAHLVLPGVSFAEKDGTFTATDRRVQRVRKAIEPVGDSRQDWQIICQVAQKMGASGFEFNSAEEILAEAARLTPSYGGISFERLEQLGFIQWPCPSSDHPGTTYLHKGKFARGLGKFTAIPFKAPAEVPDSDYPFTLTTGRIMFQFHTGTMTRRSKKLASEAPEAYIEIHPDDAKTIGLNGNRLVRVSSRRGEITLKVRVTDRIKPGIVFIPFHYAEAAANMLTNSAIDPIAKIPEYKVCAVKVEPAV